MKERYEVTQEQVRASILRGVLVIESSSMRDLAQEMEGTFPKQGAKLDYIVTMFEELIGEFGEIMGDWEVKTDDKEER